LIKSRFLSNHGVAVAEVSVRGRAVVAAEETGSSDVDSGGRDRQNREWCRGDRQGLRVLG
jgi:hypothetical protein